MKQSVSKTLNEAKWARDEIMAHKTDEIASPLRVATIFVYTYINGANGYLFDLYD